MRVGPRLRAARRRGQLRRRSLRAHLRSCAACRDFAGAARRDRRPARAAAGWLPLPGLGWLQGLAAAWRRWRRRRGLPGPGRNRAGAHRGTALLAVVGAGLGTAELTVRDRDPDPQRSRAGGRGRGEAREVRRTAGSRGHGGECGEARHRVRRRSRTRADRRGRRALSSPCAPSHRAAPRRRAAPRHLSATAPDDPGARPPPGAATRLPRAARRRRCRRRHRGPHVVRHSQIPPGGACSTSCSRPTVRPSAPWSSGCR